MSENFNEKHAISPELSNVKREKLKRKSHRVCRRDHEAGRINVSIKVRERVYASILSCIP